MAESTATPSDLRASVDALKGDMAQVRADLANLGKVLTDRGKQEASSAGDSIRETARERMEQLRHALESAKDRSGKAVEATQHQISEHPITAVAIAFGVGLLVGRLLDRR